MIYNLSGGTSFPAFDPTSKVDLVFLCCFPCLFLIFSIVYVIAFYFWAQNQWKVDSRCRKQITVQRMNTINNFLIKFSSSINNVQWQNYFLLCGIYQMIWKVHFLFLLSDFLDKKRFVYSWETGQTCWDTIKVDKISWPAPFWSY